MPRYRIVVGMVRCHTDVGTMDSIVVASGLRAQATDEPDLFCLTDCGRGAEPEIGSDLLAAAREHLEHAVLTGAIPAWSLVGPR